jgi:DNA-binding transcriptional LysR family regulator
MDLKLLKCFAAVADELHFGRAAQKLDILPSALGRNIRLLEEELGLRLFARTTRNVSLTPSGQILLHESRQLLAQADTVVAKVRKAADSKDRVFRIGAIDSAATGLIPQLVHDYRESFPDVEIALVEDKTAKLLPKLLSGALDVAFVRPPLTPRPEIEFQFLLDEPTVVALSSKNALARKKKLTIKQLKDTPFIVPSPRSRPHSYNLTMRLFLEQDLQPEIVQHAEEKQTIVNMVGAGIGAALVPYWTTRITIEGVVYIPLVDDSGEQIKQLPLAAAWVKGTADDCRDDLVGLVNSKLDDYSR